MVATPHFAPNSIGALARFGLLALVPVIALGAVLGHELNVDVQQRYLETASSSATLIAQVGIQPLLNVQEVDGGLSSAQISQIDAELQGAAVSQEIRRIKVWNRSGTVVYSDNPALIGKTVPIDDDLGAALAGHPKASLTDGHSAENAGDNLSGLLIQVYVPLVFQGTSSPSGAFELYLPYAPVQAAIDRESQRLYLVLAAGLLLFYASMFPVVLLADRWRRRLQREADAAATANLDVLERLNKLKSEFLTRISHQFRTALVGIEGFSEVIRDSEDLDLVTVKAFASDIYNDAERLDRAFVQMLELDRMEAGGTILKIAHADINQLITGVAAVARIANPKAVFTLSLDPSMPEVSCDRDRVSQVVTILISNAIKYSPAGSSIVVSSQVESANVKVTVKDEGPGMPPEFEGGLLVGYQPHVKGAVNGLNGRGHTGLGLPIARHIVEMHGGKIWFDSSAGRGSEFHFTLPLQVRPQRDVEVVALNT